MISRTSPIVRLAVRAATPIALLIAAYALFVGHNQPGGGFAAGLLLGAVIVLRTVAGLQRPRHAIALLAAGGITVCIVAIAPLLWGNALLDQVVVSREVPLLGRVKSGSALVFDLGVVAVVVGLVTAVLDGFGATSLVDRGLRGEGNDALRAERNDGLRAERSDGLRAERSDGPRAEGTAGTGRPEVSA